MLIPNLPAPLPVDWLRRVGVEKIGPVSSLRSLANDEYGLQFDTVYEDEDANKFGLHVADRKDLAESRRLRLYPRINIRL